MDAAGTPTKSYAATFDYKNSAGELEIDHGFLPNGFVAIDLAHALGLPLYDPDTRTQSADGQIGYALVDPAHVSDKVHQRPVAGNGVLGGTGRLMEKTDAEVIVAANGGSDLIYVPNNSTKRVRQIVAFLSTQDYVGAIFVDDRYGAVPGALPLSSVGLQGGAVVPHPAVAISFRTFYLQKDDLMSAIQIADTSLHQGQGMHGSFGRDNTLNNMAAIGPDFKSEYEDPLPVSNADIAPTLAYLLGFQNAPKGKLTGRVIREALKGEMATARAVNLLRTSKYSKAKSRTVLHAQRLGATVYYDEACLLKAGATQQLKECR